MKENRTRFYLDLAERFCDEVIHRKRYLTPRYSLDDAASRLGASRYDLSHAVNDCLGKSFCRFVNELRVADAMHLMRSADGRRMKVRRIAELTGFSDRKTFCRVCKEITGHAPSALRDAPQADSAEATPQDTTL